MAKERLDRLLFRRGFFSSRAKAIRAILAGEVYLEGKRIDKPGTRVESGARIGVKKRSPYVSRGGEKLEKALKEFRIDIKEKITLDAGASTGGFTDCLLKHGAKKVYAVDVGYGQLAWRLRRDPRVVVLERRNIRYLKKEELKEEVDLVTLDLSFISLTKVLERIDNLLTLKGEIVTLIKPQFEAGREKVKKGGVVRDPGVHREVILKVIDKAKEIGLKTKGLIPSPLKGPAGNIEYFIHLVREGKEIEHIPGRIREVVSQAHGG
ncbi:MAG TPA: TlyA family RNA methyltransferase [bacterium]|nr:TlyA family RNA methyltransferase [bacterium]